MHSKEEVDLIIRLKKQIDTLKQENRNLIMAGNRLNNKLINIYGVLMGEKIRWQEIILRWLKLIL